MTEERQCEVCGAEPVVGVAAVPGIAYSAAYGANCLRANAHPYDLLVANTAICGGFERTAEWWQDMVADTLAHLGRTIQQFTADVAAAEREMP